MWKTHKEKVWKHKLFNSAKQGQGQYISQESIIITNLLNKVRDSYPRINFFLWITTKNDVEIEIEVDFFLLHTV